MWWLWLLWYWLLGHQPPHRQPVHGRVWSQGPPNYPPPSHLIAKVGEWHPSHPRCRTQPTTTTTHQLTGPQHTVHSWRTRNRWLHTFSGHQGHTRTQQHHPHHSLQETNTYKSTPTLEQQPLHNSQKQCIQHPSTQGQSSFQHTRRPYKGIGTPKEGTHAISVPQPGSNRLQQQFLLKHNPNNNNTQEEVQTNYNNQDNNNRQQNKNTYMVTPYIKGLGEKFKRTCKKQGIQVDFKETNTVKQLIMASKDKDPKLTKSDIIYRHKYPSINCTEQYIGESGKTPGERYKEHLKAPSSIHLHTSTTGHPVSPECFIIVDREAQGLTRNIKEAITSRLMIHH